MKYFSQILLFMFSGLVLMLVVDFGTEDPATMKHLSTSTRYAKIEVVNTRQYKQSKKYYREISFRNELGEGGVYTTTCGNAGYYEAGAVYLMPVDDKLYRNSLGKDEVVEKPNFCAIRAPKA